MTDNPIQIKRYPNRRYYARNTSKYVSLQEIEEMVKDGDSVEIRDSQTNEDLTRAVLTQIIMERQPEKMALFPTDMLHFILRSNDAMSDFLRDYFHHSLTYLNYLQRHTPSPSTLTQPMHWVKAWLDGISAKPQEAGRQSASGGDAAALAERVALLEARLRQIEEKETPAAESNSSDGNS